MVNQNGARESVSVMWHRGSIWRVSVDDHSYVKWLPTNAWFPASLNVCLHHSSFV